MQTEEGGRKHAFTGFGLKTDGQLVKEKSKKQNLHVSEDHGKQVAFEAKHKEASENKVHFL